MILGIPAILPAQIILVDFGAATTPSGFGWNNVVANGSTFTTQIADLVDSTGTSTGYTLDIAGFNPGPNETGVGTVVGAFPATATQDNLYGTTVQFVGYTTPNPTLALSNLDPSAVYDFTVFASRMGVADIRTAHYSITGANNGTAVLDASNNMSDMVHITGISPTGSGVIDISITANPDNDSSYGFMYLGVLQITAVPEPSTYGLFAGIASLMVLLIRRRRLAA